VFADAVAAIVGASMAARSRWPEIGELPAWLLAAAVTGGRLLAPGLAPIHKINRQHELPLPVLILT
jgi:hypothetical protein